MKKLFTMIAMTMLMAVPTNINAGTGNNAGEEIIVRGKRTHITGHLPEVGKKAPELTAVKSDMTEVKLSDFKGKRVILNIFPSLDTPTCSTSVRFFNEAAAELDNTVVLCLSMDLPFAQERFCTTEGIENVLPLSLFRSEDFNNNYGLIIAEGALKGLAARAVVLIDENGTVKYTQLVENISDEPDYESVLKLIR